MATVTALDAKNRFGALLKRVAKGEDVVITRHEKPIARIVPIERQSVEDVHAAVDSLVRLRARIASRPRGRRLTAADVRSAIDEGRR